MSRSAQTTWRTRSRAPALEPGEIHVWYIPLDTADCRPDWLSDAERGRLSGIPDPGLKAHFCASRTALRRLLADYLAAGPDELAIRPLPGGKPRLAGDEVRFNLSHSGGRMLLGVTRGREIGVDIEQPRVLRNMQSIAQRLFSPEDFQALRESDFDEDHFFECWTRHEARQKCLGEGIFGRRADPDAFRTHSFTVDRAFACVAWAEPELPSRLQYYRYRRV